MADGQSVAGLGIGKHYVHGGKAGEVVGPYDVGPDLALGDAPVVSQLYVVIAGHDGHNALVGKGIEIAVTFLAVAVVAPHLVGLTLPVLSIDG